MRKQLITFGVLSILISIGLSGCINKNDGKNTELGEVSIIYFKSDKISVYRGDSVILSWEVVNATNITIDNRIGVVDKSGDITITPESNRTYTITASNYISRTTATVYIELLEESKKVSNFEYISQGTEINLPKDSILISDIEDKKTTLSLASLSKNYPILITNNSADMTSIEVFKKQYNSNNILNPITPEEVSSYWNKSDYIVVANSENYEEMLYAASYASRCNIPLLFSDSQEINNIANKLGAKKIFVGLSLGEFNLSISRIEEYMLEDNDKYAILASSSDKNTSVYSILAPILVGARNAILVNIQNPTYEKIKDKLKNINELSDIENLVVITTFDNENIPIFRNLGPSEMFEGDIISYDFLPVNYTDFNDDDYIDATPSLITGLNINDASALIAKNLFYQQIIKNNKVTFYEPYTDIRGPGYMDNPSYNEEGDLIMRPSEMGSSIDPAVESQIINNMHYFDTNSNTEDVRNSIDDSSIFIYNGHASWSGLYCYNTGNVPEFNQPIIAFIHGCSVLEPYHESNIGLEILQKGAVFEFAAINIWASGGTVSCGNPWSDISSSFRGLIESLNDLTVGEAYKKWYNDGIMYDKVLDRPLSTGKYVILIGDPSINPNIDFNETSEYIKNEDSVIVSTKYQSEFSEIVGTCSYDVKTIPYFTGLDVTTDVTTMNIRVWLKNSDYNSVEVIGDSKYILAVTGLYKDTCRIDDNISYCPYMVSLQSGGVALPNNITLKFTVQNETEHEGRILYESYGSRPYFINDEEYLNNGYKLFFKTISIPPDASSGTYYIEVYKDDEKIDGIYLNIGRNYFKYEDSFIYIGVNSISETRAGEYWPNIDASILSSTIEPKNQGEYTIKKFPPTVVYLTDDYLLYPTQFSRNLQGFYDIIFYSLDIEDNLNETEKIRVAEGESINILNGEFQIEYLQTVDPFTELIIKITENS